MTPLLVAFLESDIKDLDNPGFTHPETLMKERLGDRYSEYVRDLKERYVPYEQLSHRGKQWSDAMGQLLRDTQQALNLRHVTLGKRSEKQRKRVWDLQSRAEELMHQYGEDIVGTSDEPHFRVQNDINEDDYYDAQMLIENWELPRVKKPDLAGMTPVQHRNQTQYRFLTALLEGCNPSAPVKSENIEMKAKLNRFRRFAS